MKKRNLLSVLFSLLCLAALGGIIAQEQRISALRAEKRQLLNQGEPVSESGAVSADEPVALAETASTEVSTELLRLRNEVTRLGQQRRALSSVLGENQRLKSQLDNRNATGGGAALPAGYIRTSEAKFMGYATPENTMQSIQWAIARQDYGSLLKGLEPATAQKFQTSVSSNQFFQDAKVFVGLAIKERTQLGDGSIELTTEIMPEVPPQKLHFVPLNGEWKLTSFP